MKRQRILSVLCIMTLVLTAGCGKAKTVVNYPIPVVSKGTEDTGAESNAEENDTEKNVTEEPVFEMDSIRSNGKFYFNPEVLNPIYKEHVSEDIQNDAKAILNAIYNHEQTVDLSKIKPDAPSARLAMGLASLSSAIAEVCYIEEEENGVYRIIYGMDESEFEKLVSDYEEKLTSMIDEIIEPADTDAQRAYKVYKYLVENMEFDYGFLDSLDETSIRESEYVPSIRSFVDGKGEIDAFELNYMYILFQLGIENNIIGSIGRYEPQNCALLDDIMPTQETFMCNVIHIGDNWYNCNIVFEKVVYDEIKADFESAECEMKYFGMSDDTCDKSWQVHYSREIFNIVASKTNGTPECTEDLEIE